MLQAPPANRIRGPTAALVLVSGANLAPPTPSAESSRKRVESSQAPRQSLKAKRKSCYRRLGAQQSMAPRTSHTSSRRCTKRTGNSQARGRDLRNKTPGWCLQGTRQRVLAEDLGSLFFAWPGFVMNSADHLHLGTGTDYGQIIRIKFCHDA